MTEQEALEILKISLPFVASKEVNEAAGKAVEALEKQITKKPIRKPNADWTGEEITCLACGKLVSLHEHHCKCGQKLDWSEA